MPRSLVSKRLLAVLGAVIGLAGCPDPDARYDEFLDRSQAERSKNAPDFGPGETSDRTDISGRYFFALATELDEGKPLLFQADITIDKTNDPDWTIDMQLTALRSWCGGCGGDGAFCAEDDATRREPLMPAIANPGPVPYAEDGTFEIDFGEITAPCGVNAISGAEIKANLRLFGQTQPSGTVCGQVQGNLIDPFEFTLRREANNFGTVAAPDGTDFNSLSPVGRCL